jgi:hypothetical protein
MPPFDRRHHWVASRSLNSSYEMTDFDGVTFASRHGDDLQLWAIFERPGDPPITPNIHDVIGEEPLNHVKPEISNAFRLLGLQWEND